MAMADGRAAGLVNLAYLDESDSDVERTVVGPPDEWDDDGDPTAVTAVHALEALTSSSASEADEADSTLVEHKAPVAAPPANDTTAWKSEIRELSPRLGPPRTSSTLIPPASRASKLNSVPPAPMLFTPSAIPPAPGREATPMTMTIPASPAPPANAPIPIPMESSVVPLSSNLEETFDAAAEELLRDAVALTSPTPGAGVPAPSPSASRVEGLLFAPPIAEGSVMIPVATDAEAPKALAKTLEVPRAEPKMIEAPRPPARPPSPSFEDLRDLVGRRQTELAYRPNTEPMPPPPPSVRAPLTIHPPPMPRPSALGLEAFVDLPPPEKALESVLPPAPPTAAEVPSDQIPIVHPLGQPSQRMIQTVRPAGAGGNVVLAMVFFVGYVFRAGFGRIIDASHAMGELGREIFEGMRVEWHRALERSRR
jgi:hypothetical protein